MHEPHLHLFLPTTIYFDGETYYIQRVDIFNEATKHFSLTLYSRIEKITKDEITTKHLNPLTKEITFIDFFADVSFNHFFSKRKQYRQKLLSLPTDELYLVFYPFKIISILLAWYLKNRKLTLWVRTDWTSIQQSRYMRNKDGVLKALQRSLTYPIISVLYRAISRHILRKNLVFYTANATIDPDNHLNQHEIISTPILNRDTDLIKTNRTNTICFVGNEEPRKGLYFLLQALQKLPQETRPTLHIIGLFKIKNTKNLQLAKNLNITYHGPIYDREKFYDVLAQCDILAMPSIGEKQGKVQLEAMSVGVVPICADSGGTYQTIHNYYNGLLHRPADSNNLAQQIRKLQENPELFEQLKTNGLAYSKTLSLDDQVAKMATIIKNHYLYEK